MRILNLTQDTVIASHGEWARGWRARMTGLLGRSALEDGEALVLPRCQSVHMLFMRFPIDVIFVGRDDLVVGLAASLQPYRFSPIFFKANYAIEGEAGMIARSRTQKGDRVAVKAG